MDYDLAESLMDAGFPQIGKGSLIGPPNKLVWRSGDRVYAPTLEELIEACGENFALLINNMTGGSPLRILIRVALRKPLPKPSPACGSHFKNDDRQEGAWYYDVRYWHLAEWACALHMSAFDPKRTSVRRVYFSVVLTRGGLALVSIRMD